MSIAGPTGPRPPAESVSLSAARAGVLDCLRSVARTCTVRELAELLDLHPNTVREHLDALVDSGLVERDQTDPSGRGRPALVYRAAIAVSDVARDYEMLTEVLAGHIASLPDPVSASEAAGRQWAGQLSRDEPQGLLENLAQLGFEPTPPDEHGTTILRACPVLAVARRHPEVVCSAHLGMARALLEGAGLDPDDVELVPGGHPEGCVLRAAALAASA